MSKQPPVPQWTPEQRAELDREYARIRIPKGTLLPAPRRELTPDEALALFRSIPDGAGAQGYMDALARFFSKKK